MTEQTPPWKDRPVFVLGGPNLSRLGSREPEVYGHSTYYDLEKLCHKAASNAGLTVEVRQTDAEHEMLAWLHSAADGPHAVVINPAAWTHTSVAVRDAVAMIDAPVIEVHISNVHQREEFRRHSYVSGVATGVIAGLGLRGYAAALGWLGSLAADGAT